MDEEFSEEFAKLSTRNFESFRNIRQCLQLHVMLIFKSDNGKTIHVDSNPNVVIDRSEVEKEPPRVILKSANINHDYEIVMLNLDFER